jgi:phospholipid transport system substrate-binding protein
VKQFLAILILGFMPSAVMAQAPNDVIQETADELATALDGRKEEFAADKVALYAMIDSILLPRFDRRYAAQLVLGRPWRDATAEQRDRFVDGFYSSMLRRYANGVLEFDQSKMKILPFRGDLEKKRTTVKTTVVLNDGTKVPVNYEMVNRDSGWMMFDVKIEGISYIRNFKTEINSEIQSTSLEAVIERIEGEAQAAAS